MRLVVMSSAGEGRGCPVLPSQTHNGRARLSVRDCKVESYSALKVLPELAEAAGSVAFCGGFDWTVCWSWAGSQCGLVDHLQLYTVALHFLTGWECERFHAHGGRPLRAVVELHRDAVKRGLGDFPTYPARPVSD